MSLPEYVLLQDNTIQQKTTSSVKNLGHAYIWRLETLHDLHFHRFMHVFRINNSAKYVSHITFSNINIKTSYSIHREVLNTKMVEKDLSISQIKLLKVLYNHNINSLQATGDVKYKLRFKYQRNNEIVEHQVFVTHSGGRKLKLMEAVNMAAEWINHRQLPSRWKIHDTLFYFSNVCLSQRWRHATYFFIMTFM